MSEREQDIGHEAHVFISLVRALASQESMDDYQVFELWSATYGTRRAGDESSCYASAALVACQLARRLAQARGVPVIEVLDELDQRIFDAANEPGD